MTDKSKPPVQIDVGARAEARFEVKTEVPSQSAGRLVDALTDIIRPFSEARGLRADQIRLQGEEVAIEIAKRAKRRLTIEGAAISPIPNKVLVPLIEAASSEDPGDEEMITMWANLLASAATNSEIEPRYIGILRELRGKQAAVFERVAFNAAHPPTLEIVLAELDDAPYELHFGALASRMDDLVGGAVKRGRPDQVAEVLEEYLDRPGCALIDVIVIPKKMFLSV